MSSWFAETAVAEPVTRPRAKPKSRPAAKPRPRAKPRVKAKSKRRARGGVLWIAISGILLAGVVFVNVAVLRLNLDLDKATHDRAQLQAQDNTLASLLSSELASPRIQKQAQKDGLVQVDPSTIGYINLGR